MLTIKFYVRSLNRTCMICLLCISSLFHFPQFFWVSLDVSQFLGHAILKMNTHAVLPPRIQFSFSLQLANSYTCFETLATSLHFLREAIFFRWSRVFLLSDSKGSFSSSFIVLLKFNMCLPWKMWFCEGGRMGWINIFLYSLTKTPVIHTLLVHLINICGLAS